MKFHKAKLLKKRFVPRLVTEKLKREINLNEIKYALSLPTTNASIYLYLD